MAASFDVSDVVSALRAARNEWRQAQSRSREPGGRELPSPQAVEKIVEQLKGVLFPMRLGPSDLRHDSEDFYVGYTLHAALQAMLAQAVLELRFVARSAPPPQEELLQRAQECIRGFAQALPSLRRLLDTDVLAAFQGDPAARSVDEVLLCYPGVLAMIHHRIAHTLYVLGLPILARIITEIAHSQTGIDIHPGAQIGQGFFIDHGTGVVIGETAVIGERVRLYQNVTLGAKRFPAAEDGTLQKGLPRHPVVEDDVVIYGGATVLGRVRLGRGAVIGGNVWVTHDVPAGGSVTQARGNEGRAVA
jgi:serine O-acetyltransferase